MCRLRSDGASPPRLPGDDRPPRSAVRRVGRRIADAGGRSRRPLAEGARRDDPDPTVVSPGDSAVAARGGPRPSGSGNAVRRGQDARRRVGSCWGSRSSLWTFASREGVEPTNNAAERAVRHAVFWRKTSCGTASERGSRFVERMLTVVATCRSQGRDVLDFLVESIHAHRSGGKPPSLIPAGRERLRSCRGNSRTMRFHIRDRRALDCMMFRR